ncbi:hypothetical protein IPV69_02755 [Humisphaera borealis]|uniref:Ketosynthase family 3 (KS3) domain-containing protein n=1 Tax=Humisphaera borealis TaxID=2807512 RepID=A0A7M2WY15_9BACT|nr:hypothetical protein IPV69_02755 [Humisphaera borealis]
MSAAGLIAAREALAAASLTSSYQGAISTDRTALVVGTSRGPVDEWLDFPELSRLHHGFGISTLAARLAEGVGHGNGPRLTFCGACASGLHALIHAAMLIEHGDADRALVVASESSLHPVFLQSFRRLGVLAPKGFRCRPFDVSRNGLLVSEAAAAITLERSEEPGKSAPGDIILDGRAFAGDAAHLTGFDPDGATIRRVLSEAIGGGPVDLIHAHGTGTVTNDAAEASAIDAALSDIAAAGERPSVYSHKGAIGHSLGASGLISVVLNVMMHRRGVVPGNAGLESPLPLARATLSRDAVSRTISRSIACAAGFGGATAAVSLRTR